MDLKGRPLGIWLLAIWCAAHIIPAILVSAEASGWRTFAIWLVVAVELAIAGGSLMHWAAARYALAAQIAVHISIAALVVWAFVFVAFAWGLHVSDAPIVASAVAYLLLGCWAFIYLFSPGVVDYFSGSARHAEGLRGGLFAPR